MYTPLAIAVAAILVLATPVEAKRRQVDKVAAPVSEFVGDRYSGNAAEVRQEEVTKTSRRGRRAEYSSDAQIVAHPAGCPARLFCGCGVSVKVFGKPVRNLYLAANWLKFPRASPASGMVAARKGHVMYILSYDGNGQATVYDPNSGGRKTRIHTRSLSGYRVVNPHGSTASL